MTEILVVIICTLLGIIGVLGLKLREAREEVRWLEGVVAENDETIAWLFDEINEGGNEDGRE